MIRNPTYTVNLFGCPSDSSEVSYFSDLALPEAKNATERILAVKLRQTQSLRSILLIYPVPRTRVSPTSWLATASAASPGSRARVCLPVCASRWRLINSTAGTWGEGSLGHWPSQPLVFGWRTRIPTTVSSSFSQGVGGKKIELTCCMGGDPAMKVLHESAPISALTKKAVSVAAVSCRSCPNDSPLARYCPSGEKRCLCLAHRPNRCLTVQGPWSRHRWVPLHRPGKGIGLGPRCFVHSTSSQRQSSRAWILTQNFFIAARTATGPLQIWSPSLV